MLAFTVIGLGISVLAGALLLAPVVRSSLRERGPGAARTEEVVAVARRLSIVIPARNEEGSLGKLLESIALQSVRPLETIVVDDQSTDATASIAERLGARVVSVPERPADWLGKPWASHLGAEDAAGDYLLFLDADVVLGEHALEALLARFLAVGAEAGAGAEADKSEAVISVQPYHRADSAYERLALFFNIQVFAGTASRTRGLQLRLEGSCCFGPCILCSSSAYRAIGGHRAVKSCVLEDIELGNLFKDAGYTVRGFAGRGDIEFRMYPDGLGSMIDGFSKNLLLGVLRANPWFFFLDVFWVSGLVAAPALAAIAAASGMWVELATAGGFYAVLATQVLLAGRRLGSFGVPTALFYPVPLSAFLLVVGRVALLAVTRRQVLWKGRRVDPFAVRR